jgi:hypothetical protein
VYFLGPLFLSVLATRGASGVTELPLAVRSVVYDPFTDKLYASATNNLLQLDPLTGKVLNSFYLGTNVTLLSLGAENGLWAAIDGEQSIRRFDLATLTAGDKIVVSIPRRSIVDLYGSSTDSTLALVCLPTVNGHWAEGFVVRNGSVLPDSQIFTGNVNVPLFGALRGSSVYLSYKGTIYKLALGANGLIDLGQSFSSPTSEAPAELRLLGSEIYCGGGFAVAADSLQLSGTVDAQGVVAVSAADSVVYYLTSTFNAPVITRYAHPSLQKISSAELGGISSGNLQSLTGYGNHAAFNNDSNLYIVDLDKAADVRPPAQLEIAQSAPDSIEFGASLDLWVYVTNRGPSTAQITVGDSISAGSAFSPFGWITADSPISAPGAILSPGTGFSYVVTVQPPKVGLFTNRVVITSTNTDPVETVSTQVINVTAPIGPITTITGVFANTPGYNDDLAYDSHSGDLFALSGLQMRLIDPQAPAIVGFLTDNGAGQITSSISGAALFRNTGSDQVVAADAGGVLFILSGGGHSIQRINTSDFSESNFATSADPVLDLLASPTDTNLIAIVTPTGTQLIRNGQKLANTTTASGAAQFSADGSKFYVANAADCVLDIFNVDQNGLTLVQTRTNASCSTFTEADGLIYFSTGAIYDPAPDKHSSFGFTAPVFVVPRGGQVIDVVARTNNTWTVQRLAGSDRHLVRSVAVTQLSSSAGISRVRSAGPDRVAIASGGTLYIVNLGAPNQLSVAVSLKDSATATLRIDSALGAVYRIEAASVLGESTWTTVQDNIAGTGAAIEVPVPIQTQQNAFFRAVRESP